jgi:hypothetical protein
MLVGKMETFPHSYKINYVMDWSTYFLSSCVKYQYLMFLLYYNLLPFPHQLVTLASSYNKFEHIHTHVFQIFC